ncbi:MAG TPA: GAP family protein [Ilumatobacteraceae bacterium]|nr:GAP family protein [Ilumatobacteraceae bacterium]
MISASASVLFYALVAAASPLVLAAVLVVIRSDRRRANSIAFLVGFVLGTTIAAVVGLMLGQAAVERLDSHETIEGVLALLVGVALIVAGLAELRSPKPPGGTMDRQGATLARLSHVGPGTALSIAGLLGFGGPKRLILAFLAMTSVSEADLGDLESVTLLVLYVAVATLLVSVPVTMVVIGGRRAAEAIGRGESWLGTNAALLRLWLALGLGGALVIDGLVRLT